MSTYFWPRLFLHLKLSYSVFSEWKPKAHRETIVIELKMWISLFLQLEEERELEITEGAAESEWKKWLIFIIDFLYKQSKDKRNTPPTFLW